MGCTLAAAFAAELWAFDEHRAATIRVALTMLGVMYVGWQLSFLLALRLFLGNERGALAVFSVMFIAKVADAGAYFVGKRFWTHQAGPSLESRKDGGRRGGRIRLGTFGGSRGLLLDRARCHAGQRRRYMVGPRAGYGLSLAGIGVFGDLCESLLKRDMRRKDSSGWLPGLGGLMDICDSVLMAAPAAFFWWTTGWLGG